MYKLKFYNTFFYQIIDKDTGKMVQGITQLTNGMWRLTDMMDKTWGPKFDTPREALAHWETYGAKVKEA